MHSYSPNKILLTSISGYKGNKMCVAFPPGAYHQASVLHFVFDSIGTKKELSKSKTFQRTSMSFIQFQSNTRMVFKAMNYHHFSIILLQKQLY